MTRTTLAVILLFLTLISPTHYKSPDPQLVTILGITEWNCGKGGPPDAWVSADVVLHDPETAREVAVHEITHRRQMLAYGSCLNWTLAVLAPGGWKIGFEMEAEAFCESAKEALRSRRYATLDDAISARTDNLMLYGFPIDRRQAKQKIESYCIPTKDTYHGTDQ